MIEFDEAPKEFKLLRRVVRQAQREKNPIPSLSNLAPKRSVDELTEIAKGWQRARLGRVIEEVSNGIRSVSFVVERPAVEAVRAVDQLSWCGRIKQVTRSEWIAIAAFIVSIIALFKGN